MRRLLLILSLFFSITFCFGQQFFVTDSVLKVKVGKLFLTDEDTLPSGKIQFSILRFQRLEREKISIFVNSDSATNFFLFSRIKRLEEVLIKHTNYNELYIPLIFFSGIKNIMEIEYNSSMIFFKSFFDIINKNEKVLKPIVITSTLRKS